MKPRRHACASSRRESTADRTTGATTRPSSWSSTSGVLEDFPSNTIPGFVDGLLDLLPEVGRHSCSTGKAGGFEQRLREGTWAGHVAEHIALQLQRDAGTEVGRGKTRSTGEPGRYHVVYGYAEESRGARGRPPRGADRQPPGGAGGRLRLRGRVREAGPAGRARRVRPVDAGDPRRGRAARHPVDPAQRAVAGPARPRHPSAADPRDHDQPDQLPGRGHRVGQEAHQQAAGRRPGSRCRGPRWCAARTRRPAAALASASRWRSSRSTATTAAA